MTGCRGGEVSVVGRAVDLVEIQAATAEEVSEDKCRRAADAVSVFFFFLFALCSA